MPKKNIKLLKRLRTRFLRMRHPSHFKIDQIAIKTDCGAAMCYIGHTLELAGYKMRVKKGGDSDYDEHDAARCDFDFIAPSGRVVSEPFHEAARLLGLSEKSKEAWLDSGASALFQDYSIKTPKQAAKRITKLIEEG